MKQYQSNTNQVQNQRTWIFNFLIAFCTNALDLCFLLLTLMLYVFHLCYFYPWLFSFLKLDDVLCIDFWYALKFCFFSFGIRRFIGPYLNSSMNYFRYSSNYYDFDSLRLFKYCLIFVFSNAFTVSLLMYFWPSFTKSSEYLLNRSTYPNLFSIALVNEHSSSYCSAP